MNFLERDDQESKIALAAIDAEAAVIGCIFANEKAYWKVCDRISAEHFYEPVHAMIFHEIASRFSAGQGASPVVIGNALRESLPAELGGTAYLARLAGAATAVYNVIPYAETIRDLYIRRTIMEAANEALEGCRNASIENPTLGVVAKLESQIHDAVKENGGRGEVVSMSDMAARVIATVEKTIETGKPQGISTGLKSFDEANGLLMPGDLIVIGGSTSMGKALALNTPIATPSGWTTMGEIRAGDVVFDEDGKPTPVRGTSEIMLGHKCFSVKFSDGAEIIADAEHLWITSSHDERVASVRRSHEFRAKRRSKRALTGSGTKPSTSKRNTEVAEKLRLAENPNPVFRSIRTTEEIAATLYRKDGAMNHRIDLAGPLDLPERLLPIDPYILGIWLGDGSSSKPIIHCGDEDLSHFIAQIELAGLSADFKRRKTANEITIRPFGSHAAQDERIKTYRPAFVDLGLLNNKHIPAEYLRSSIAQRTALLQGLMDTDGHCDTNGRCEFTTCSLALRDGMSELLHSLGIKVKPAEQMATLDGRDINPKFRLNFVTEIPVFRLEWKLARMRNHHKKAFARTIVSVEAVASVPVKCIAVESESHLYLAGKEMIPTHNTALAQQIIWNTARNFTVDQDGRRQTGARSLVFSMEMSGEQYTTRHLAQLSGIRTDRIEGEVLSDIEYGKLRDAADVMRDMPIQIEDARGLNVERMRSIARRHQHTHGLDLMLVDHLGFVAAPDRRMNKLDALEANVAALKGMAHELNCPIILISHLNRGIWNRDDKRPQLSDLHGASAIEKDADVVAFVHREEYWLRKAEPAAHTSEWVEWEAMLRLVEGKAEIINGKRRRGRANQTRLCGFDGQQTKFYDLDGREVML